MDMTTSLANETAVAVHCPACDRNLVVFLKADSDGYMTIAECNARTTHDLGLMCVEVGDSIPADAVTVDYCYVDPDEAYGYWA